MEKASVCEEKLKAFCEEELEIFCEEHWEYSWVADRIRKSKCDHCQFRLIGNSGINSTDVVLVDVKNGVGLSLSVYNACGQALYDINLLTPKQSTQVVDDFIASATKEQVK